MSKMKKLFDKLPKMSPRPNKVAKPPAAKSGPNAAKPGLTIVSPATKQQIARLAEQIKVVIAPLKERLAPLIKYYEGLNKREKLIVQVGGTFLAAYLIFQIIITPYQGWRDQVIAERNAAYEEFTWLESQTQRVADAILSRGGDFNARLDVGEIFNRYAPEAQIEESGDGEYTITLSSSSGEKLFNAINAVINRGGKLLSVELERASGEAGAIFVTKVSI